MDKSFKRDTLAYQIGSRPYTQRVSLTHLPTQVLASKMRQALDHSKYDPCGMVGVDRVSNPEVDALEFYLVNHAVALVSKQVHPLEPLGKYIPLLEVYNDVLAEQTRRMFYYLLAICTRESRHNHADLGGKFWASAVEKYGYEAKSFHQTIKGKGSDGAVNQFCAQPPMMSLGKYTSYLADSFYKGQYSGGYGGKPWGDIAECLRKFVHGEFSAEMMLDTAFTLCHNNGPIFNKGMFFDMYTPDIYKILDVQRSGQIPQLIHTKGVARAGSAKVQGRYKTVAAILGDELLGGQPYVDWYAVEAMGSLKQYPQEKKEQDKNGHQKAGKQAPTIIGMDPAANPEDLLEIMPGVFVKKVEVERVEA